MTRLLTCVFLCFCFQLSAQLKQPEMRAIVWLKGKSESLQTWDPLKHFTPASICRRFQSKIAWDFNDLPVSTTYIQELEALELKVLGASRWQNAVLVEGEVKRVYELPFIDFVQEFDAVDISKRRETAGILDNQGKVVNSTELLDFVNIPVRSGTGKRIAVFDSGFRGLDTLPDFQFTDIIETQNFVHPENAVYDEGTHGTSVMSFLVSQGPNLNVGFAPDAEYFLYVTEDINQERLIEEFYWSLAAERSDALGVDIINSSLSYTRFDEASENHEIQDMTGSQTIAAQAANLASKRGMIVVVSAGNQGAKEWKRLGTPADASLALTVGALNGDFPDQIPQAAQFSSYGPNAIGENKPEVTAPGQNLPYLKSDGTVGQGSGTSFSAPIISGCVASLWQTFPGFSADEIKQTIIRNSTRFPEWNAQLGYGWVQWDQVWSALESGGVNASNWSIFPVPAQGKFSVFPRMDEVELYNARLQQVLVSERNKGYIFEYPSDLVPGTYFVRCSQGNTSRVIPIIVE